MDEHANIYTLDFEKIGCAGESDEDDDIWYDVFFIKQFKFASGFIAQHYTLYII